MAVDIDGLIQDPEFTALDKQSQDDVLNMAKSLNDVDTLPKGATGLIPQGLLSVFPKINIDEPKGPGPQVNIQPDIKGMIQPEAPQGPELLGNKQDMSQLGQGFSPTGPKVPGQRMTMPGPAETFLNGFNQSYIDSQTFGASKILGKAINTEVPKKLSDLWTPRMGPLAGKVEPTDVEKAGSLVGSVVGSLSALGMTSDLLRAVKITPVLSQTILTKFRYNVGLGKLLATDAEMATVFASDQLVRSSMDQIYNGKLDVGKMAKDVGLSALQGATFGSINRIPSRILQASTAAAVGWATGFAATKDPRQAGINAIITGMFQFISTPGVELRMKQQAYKESIDALGEAFFKNGKVADKGEGVRFARAIINTGLEKIGVTDLNKATTDQFYKFISEVNRASDNYAKNFGGEYSPHVVAEIVNPKTAERANNQPEAQKMIEAPEKQLALPETGKLDGMRTEGPTPGVLVKTPEVKPQTVSQLAKNGVQPYQLTPEQWHQAVKLDHPNVPVTKAELNYHRTSVLKAVKQGIKVSKEILDKYPDIKTLTMFEKPKEEKAPMVSKKETTQPVKPEQKQIAPKQEAKNVTAENRTATGPQGKTEKRVGVLPEVYERHIGKVANLQSKVVADGGISREARNTLSKTPFAYNHELAGSREFQAIVKEHEGKGFDIIPTKDPSNSFNALLNGKDIHVMSGDDEMTMAEVVRHEIAHRDPELKNVMAKVDRNSEAFKKYWLELSRGFGYRVRPEDAVEELAANYMSGTKVHYGAKLDEAMGEGKTDQTIAFKASKRSLQSADDLLVMHNLTEDKLNHAIKLGGIPVPSLAVGRSTHGFEGFGDITLIAKKDLLHSEKAQTFNGDIYSPRYPDVTHEIDGKKLTEAYGGLAKRADEYFKSNDQLNNTGSIYTLEEELKGGLREVKRSQYAEKIFLYTKDVDRKISYEKRHKYIDRHQSEFEQFAEQILKTVSTGERIFTGHTPSGNRKYAPHTLSNVVSILSKELKNGEGFNYGLPSVRAQMTRRLKSIDEVRKSRGNLVAKQEMEKVKEELSKEFHEILDDANKHDSLTGSEFGSADRFVTVLIDGIRLHKVESDIKEFGFGGMNIRRVISFIEKLRDAPTEYFETKIQRAVSLNEFSGAVVPSDISSKTVDALKTNGIDRIVKYKKGDSEDRKIALSNFKDLYFSLRSRVKEGDKFHGEISAKRMGFEKSKALELKAVDEYISALSDDDIAGGVIGPSEYPKSEKRLLPTRDKDFVAMDDEWGLKQDSSLPSSQYLHTQGATTPSEDARVAIAVGEKLGYKPRDIAYYLLRNYDLSASTSPRTRRMNRTVQTWARQEEMQPEMKKAALEGQPLYSMKSRPEIRGKDEDIDKALSAMPTKEEYLKYLDDELARLPEAPYNEADYDKRTEQLDDELRPIVEDIKDKANGDKIVRETKVELHKLRQEIDAEGLPPELADRTIRIGNRYLKLIRNRLMASGEISTVEGLRKWENAKHLREMLTVSAKTMGQWSAMAKETKTAFLGSYKKDLERIFHSMSDLRDTPEVKKIRGLIHKMQGEDKNEFKTFSEMLDEVFNFVSTNTEIDKAKQQLAMSDISELKEGFSLYGMTEYSKRDPAILDFLRKVEGIRKGLIVSQPKTAMRNIEQNYLYMGLKVIEDFFAGLMTKGDIKQKFAVVSHDIGAIWSSLFGAKKRWRFLYNFMHQYEAAPEAMDMLLNTSSSSEQKGISVLVDKLNFMNSFQDKWMGQVVFMSRVEGELARMKKKDLSELPKTEQNRVVQEAIDEAMRITFRYTPKGGIGKAIMQFWRRLPFMSMLVNPFIRFQLNGLKFLLDYNPIMLLKLFKALDPKFRAEMKADDIVQRDFASAIGKAIAGGMMLLLALQVRKKQEAEGSAWYQWVHTDKYGKKRVYDMRPFAPFTQYLMAAEALLHPNKIKVPDVVESLLSINRVAGSAFSLWSAIKSAQGIKIIDKGADILGQYLGSFTVPLKALGDLIGSFNDGERYYRDTKVIPKWEMAFSPALANIPVLRQKLPASVDMYTGNEIKTEHPWSGILSQATGVNVRPITDLELYMQDNDIPAWKYVPNTSDDNFKRLVKQNMGERIAKTAPMILNRMKKIDDSTFDKTRKDDLRKKTLDEYFHAIKYGTRNNGAISKAEHEYRDQYGIDKLRALRRKK